MDWLSIAIYLWASFITFLIFATENTMPPNTRSERQWQVAFSIPIGLLWPFTLFIILMP